MTYTDLTDGDHRPLNRWAGHTRSPNLSNNTPYALLGGRHGTWSGTPGYAIPPANKGVGAAFSFNGAKAINLGDITRPASGKLAVSAWVYYTGAGFAGCVFAADDAATSEAAFNLFLVPNGQIIFYVHTSPTAWIGRRTGVAGLTLNQWNLIVATWDGTTAASGVDIIVKSLSGTQNVDSIDEVSGSFTGIYASPVKAGIGSKWNGATRVDPLTADIYDVRLYDHDFIVGGNTKQQNFDLLYAAAGSALPAVPVKSTPASRLYTAKTSVLSTGDSYTSISPDRSIHTQALFAYPGRLTHRGMYEVFGLNHPFSLRLAWTGPPNQTTVAAGGTFPGTSGLVNDLPYAVDANYLFATNQADYGILQQWIPKISDRVAFDPAELFLEIQNCAAVAETSIGNPIGDLEMSLINHRTTDSITGAHINAIGAVGLENISGVINLSGAAQKWTKYSFNRTTPWATAISGLRWQHAPSIDETNKVLLWAGAAIRDNSLNTGIVWGSNLTGGGWGVQHFAYAPGGGDPFGQGQFTDAQLSEVFRAHAAVEPIDTVFIHLGTNNAAMTSAQFRAAGKLMIQRLITAGQPFTTRPFGVIVLTPMPFYSGGEGVTDQTAAMKARRDDWYAVATQFSPSQISIADTHTTMQDLYGTLPNWSVEVLDNGLHVEETKPAAEKWGRALHTALEAAASQTLGGIPYKDVRTNLTSILTSNVAVPIGQAL